MNEERGAKGQPGRLHTLPDHGEHLAHVGFDRGGAQAIAHDDLHVGAFDAAFGHGALGLIGQQATQIGAQEIFLLAAGDLRLHFEQAQVIQQALIYVTVEGILGDGMVGLKEEERLRGVARPGPARA